MNQTSKDKLALDQVAQLMSGREWSADTLDEVADIVRATGRTIADVQLSDETLQAISDRCYGGDVADTVGRIMDTDDA